MTDTAPLLPAYPVLGLRMIAVPTVEHADPERAIFLGDILSTAVEGGSGYWADFRKAVFDHDVGAFCDMNMMAIDVKPSEPAFDDDAKDDWQHITHDRIQDGINKLLSKAVQIDSDLLATLSEAVAENDAGNIDADLADCILQVGAFGEIVFG